MREDDRDRVCRQGTEAWKRLKRDKSWSDWLKVGEAVQIGREWAMRQAGTNKPEGKGYNTAFGEWLAKYRLNDMDKGDRSRLFDVMDNLPQIEEWRRGLTLTERLRLNHPNAVLRRWKAFMEPEKKPSDAKPTLRDSVVSLSEDSAAKDTEITSLKAHVAELEASRETAVDDTVEKLLEEALQALTKCFTSLKSSEADRKGLLPPELYARWCAQQKAATGRDKLH
jgi:hypothetical protein